MSMTKNKWQQTPYWWWRPDNQHGLSQLPKWWKNSFGQIEVYHATRGRGRWQATLTHILGPMK